MNKPPAHLRSIDGLRGVAALTVVIYHFFTNAGNPEWRPFLGINLLRPLQDGWIGVNLFLILSGFCLFWPLARDPERPFYFELFMQRRFWRIVPAYYASLIIVPLAFWALREFHLGGETNQLPRSFPDVILHLLLLQSLSAESLRSWNTVTWSLSLEWTWYLFFPVAVWMFRRMGPWRAVAVFAAISVSYLVTCWLWLGPSSRLGEEQEFAIRSFLPGRLWEFGMGMFIAWAVARHRLSRGLAMAALVAVPVLLAGGHATAAIDPMLPVRNTIYGAAFSLLLLVAVAGEGYLPSYLLEAAWIQKVGECSYSLYLFHLPVVVLLTALLGRAGVNGPARFGLASLGLPLVILLARLQFSAFERPFLIARPRSIQAGAALPLQGEPTS